VNNSALKTLSFQDAELALPADKLYHFTIRWFGNSVLRQDMRIAAF
jgi:hypothetical protein